MPSSDELLRRIVSWAESEPTVKALILTGSLARNDGSADELSDIDIEIFADDHEPYARDDGWMAAIGTVWMYLPLPGWSGYPNRLVIFDGGAKVDFSLRPLAVLQAMTASRQLPELYRRGYRVLLDKAGLAAGLPTPAFRPSPAKVPSQEEFTALVEEFWFEAYHVAKYLKRDELWTAKWRDFATKELLLRMIETYEKALHGQDYDTRHLGLNLRHWAEPDVWEDVQRSFAPLDAEDSWQALDVSTGLFRRVARGAAELLGLVYPQAVDDNLAGYIAFLHTGAKA